MRNLLLIAALLLAGCGGPVAEDVPGDDPTGSIETTSNTWATPTATKGPPETRTGAPTRTEAPDEDREPSFRGGGHPEPRVPPDEHEQPGNAEVWDCADSMTEQDGVYQALAGGPQTWSTGRTQIIGVDLGGRSEALDRFFGAGNWGFQRISWSSMGFPGGPQGLEVQYIETEAGPQIQVGIDPGEPEDLRRDMYNRFADLASDGDASIKTKLVDGYDNAEERPQDGPVPRATRNFNAPKLNLGVHLDRAAGDNDPPELEYRRYIGGEFFFDVIVASVRVSDEAEGAMVISVDADGRILLSVDWSEDWPDERHGERLGALLGNLGNVEGQLGVEFNFPEPNIYDCRPRPPPPPQ